MSIRSKRRCAAAAIAVAVVVGATSAAAQATAAAPNTPRTPAANSGTATTRAGIWSWGLGVNLLRLGVLRRPEEPGYRRNYEAQLNWLSPQFTFQVTLQPDIRPWRQPTMQAMSVSGVLIAGVDTTNARKSEIALGLTVDFLNGIVGVGVALDLYRGVPVRSGAGEAGMDVAPTGLFSAAFLRDGEVTPENIFFLLNINFVAVGRTVSQ